MWVTSEKKRFESVGSLAWQRAGGPGVSETIELNPDQRFQEILGFGAAFTDASCYMFRQLSEDARGKLFHELFHPSEMALNVCRTCIGASDYSTELFGYDRRRARSGTEAFLDRSRQSLRAAFIARRTKSKSGSFPVFLAVESARLDEGKQIHAGRMHSKEILPQLCAAFREVSASVRGGRRADPGGHIPERGGYGPGWPYARLPLGTRVRN